MPIKKVIVLAYDWVPDVTLNLISGAILYAVNWVENLDKPEIWALIGSMIFLNVARAIAALRKKK